MTPHLTQSGRTILIAAATFVVIGTVVTNWPLLLFGEAMLVMLTVLYFLQAGPLLALEEGFIGLMVRLDDDDESGSGMAGRPVTIRVEVTNLARLRLLRCRVSAEHAPELSFEPSVAELRGLGANEAVSFAQAAVLALPDLGREQGLEIEGLAGEGECGIEDEEPGELEEDVVRDHGQTGRLAGKGMF